MAAGDPFAPIVDSGTYTPETLLLRSRLAQAMQQLQNGTDISPIASPWQGLARMANAAIGGYEQGQLERQILGDQQARNASTASRIGISPSPASPGAAPGANAGGDNAAAASPDQFTDFVKQKEGFSAKPYGDYKQTSIGYGTKAQPGDVTITKEEAQKRLNVELGQARGLVQANFPNLSQKQEDALTDLTFNAGPGWMGAGLGAAVKSGNWPLAKAVFEQYNRAGGELNSGLLQRRKDMSAGLLDTTPKTQVAAQPAPIRVADASGAFPQVPGVSFEGAPPAAAAGAPGGAVAAGAPTPTPAAPASPGASVPQPQAVPPATPGQPMSNAEINIRAWANIGSAADRARVQRDLMSSDPLRRQGAANEFEEAKQRVIGSLPATSPTGVAQEQAAQAGAAEKKMELEAAQQGKANPVAQASQQAAQNVKDIEQRQQHAVTAGKYLSTISEIEDLLPRSMPPHAGVKDVGHVGDVIGPNSVPTSTLNQYAGISPSGFQIGMPELATPVNAIRNVAGGLFPRVAEAQAARQELGKLNATITAQNAAMANQASGSGQRMTVSALKLYQAGSPDMNAQDERTYRGQLSTTKNAAFDLAQEAIDHGQGKVTSKDVNMPLPLVEEGVNSGKLSRKDFANELGVLKQARDIISNAPADQRAAVSQEVIQQLRANGFNPAGLVKNTTPFHTEPLPGTGAQ